ncbi:hypothetical protein C0995_007503 [Termitomyces sp. Mi166|nr:hypothetical protein C0995_007503 [Termitomyces sp. Mi166\
MLSYVFPAVRDHSDILKVFDTVLDSTAAASSVPVFCYLLFVFLFARAELIDILPRRFQMVSKLMLLIFIPAIVALNDIVIGFANHKDRDVWTFLTGFALALLVAYQLMAFCLTFYRLTKAVLNQRRIEVAASDETQLLRGTGWITAGLKFGAIETILGFAPDGFGSAIIRRSMRSLARLCIIIGLIKGLDTTENFTSLEDGTGDGRDNFRRSLLQNVSSDPRHSTLRQLSPPAPSFHSFPRVPQGLASSESGLPPAIEKATDAKEVSSAGRRAMAGESERVTIQYENGAPRLHMRFSALGVPEFPIPMSNLTRTATEVAQKPRPSRRATFHADSSGFPSPLNALGLYEPVPRTSPNVAKPVPPTNITSDPRSSPKNYRPSSKETRSESSYSNVTRSTADSYTSLSTVRELASQFPPLPTRMLEAARQSAANNGTPVDFWDDSAFFSHASSVGPMASPPISPESVAIVTPFTTGGKPPALMATRPLDTTVSDSPTTTPTTTVSGYMTTPAISMSTALTDDANMEFGSVRGSVKTRTFARDSPRVGLPTREPAEWVDFDGIPGSSLPPVIEETVAEGQTHRSQQSGSMDSMRISWLRNPDIEEPRVVQAVSLRSQVARIKSIGKAPMRVTPRPTRSGHFRNSLHIEHIQIPPREDAYNVEIIQCSLGPLYDQNVLRDSDVLGTEDLNHTHNQRTIDRGYL